MGKGGTPAGVFLIVRPVSRGGIIQMIDLRQCHVILGSKSPRRKRILEENFCLTDFVVAGSDFAEDLPHTAFASPADYALATARGKADSLVDDIIQGRRVVDSSKPWVLICADSIFAHGENIVEKPKSLAEAREWLCERFRGDDQCIDALTGVVVVVGQGRGVLARQETVVSTKCHLWPYPVSLVERYLAEHSSLVLNVSGAVALSGPGAFMIRAYDGCFFNAAGLPVAALYELLSQISLE